MARSTKASGTHESSRADERDLTATQLLKKDHETVKQLFQRYEKAGERAHETKQRLYTEIERELETHATIEEEIFYPAVQENVADAQDLVQEAIEEHNLVKRLLRELGAMSPGDEQYDAKMKVLQENVEHHIEEEEGEMFPKAERNLGSERLRELGRELQARKEALAQPTLKRIVSGVTGLIFGSGDSERAQQDQEPGESRSGRRGRSARAPRGESRAQAHGRAQQGSGGRSAAKAAKPRGAKKRAAGARSGARKRATTAAKKRGSGRSAAAKGVARRSSAKKRSSAATASSRRRTSGGRKAAKKR